MADYKSMYLRMIDATEEAINILVQTQRECEDIYMSADDAAIDLVRAKKNNRKKGRKRKNMIFSMIINTTKAPTCLTYSRWGLIIVGGDTIIPTYSFLIAPK